MKFVQNNKILVDSNAENAETGAEKQGTGKERGTRRKKSELRAEGQVGG